MEDPDLLSLGQHCSFRDCRQRDFLPFKCDCCEKVFCLEHRTYSGHDCQKASKRTVTTVICPLCARALRIGPSDNPNLVFDTHTKQDCDPANYAKVMRKKKCPVPGCKEKLTSINSYACKHCNEKVCLKHRFPEDHKCSRQSQQGPTPQPGALASLRRIFNFETATTSIARGRQIPEEPSGSSTHYNSRRLEDSAQQLQDSQHARPRLPQGPGVQANLKEICPVCGADFSSLTDLIAHSAVHQAGSSSPDVCPHCHASFPDAVSLVEHVETQHSNKTACVLC